GERADRVVVDEVHRGDQVPRHGVGAALVQAAQVAADLDVQVRGIDVLGDGGLFSPLGLPGFLSGAALVAPAAVTGPLATLLPAGAPPAAALVVAPWPGSWASGVCGAASWCAAGPAVTGSALPLDGGVGAVVALPPPFTERAVVPSGSPS